MALWQLCIACLVLPAAVWSAGPYKFPFLDPDLSWEDRVDDLVDRLTLEEAVEQMMAPYNGLTPPIPRLTVKPYTWVTECLRGQVQSNATTFAHSIGLAAAFSPRMIHDMAEAISTEVRARWNGNFFQNKYHVSQGLNCFAPMPNIMRHPLWGRNQETYGEDPYLAGVYSAAYVRGLHGNDSRYLRVTGGCKAYDMYGGPENIPESRFSFDAKVTMRDWRMTFLPQFKACVDAGTYNLMCSFNSINGIPACANEQLLINITRHEWGFKGWVVTDDGAVVDLMTAHHYTSSKLESALAAFKAGVNMELGTDWFRTLLDGYKLGNVTAYEIKERIKPLMYNRMRVGEFDPPHMNPFTKIPISAIQSEQHRALAVQVAMMTFVMLKNENNVLPLKKQVGKVAIVGPMANNCLYQYGNYAPDVMPQFCITPYQGLVRLGMNATLAEGCNDTTPCTKYDPTPVKAAVKGADLVIVCLGLGPIEAEGRDRTTIALPGNQLQLLKDAATSGSGRVIVLLFNAGPLDVSWPQTSPHVDTMLACFYPGQAAGDALFNVLTGTGQHSSPAARLPATWPAHDNEVPPITNYTMVGRTYRYYEKVPLYPFGYGLSYSTFAYSAATVMPSSVQVGQMVTATVTVKNNGPYDAEEVVQVYMSWGNPTLPAPKLQLVGFKRVFLKNGESQTLSFDIHSSQMALWVYDDKGWEIYPGPMKLYLGGQQPAQSMRVPSNVLSVTFSLTL